ncbi:phasin family protein [Sulfitobacter sabulilitoris]|uniref:Phasin, PhaP n=1 Tax=Sulfitobacter sabulilitoris TaxID=2562655 RepID=A0A5S3Q468_9RHOB|nr:phasin family protein [Sulfitobacter sabulilitoris]TMM51321.1 phasin, PhaP [Sulfitobacter sabulilitoris]
MTATPDMTTILKDTMAAFPIDASAAEGAFKSTADLNEKLGAVTLTAVEKSSEISSKWTQQTLKSLGEVSKAKAEPTAYMTAMSDFMTGYAQSATEHMSALFDVAQKAQADSLELMTAAGKGFGEKATAAAKPAATKATTAAK